MAGYRYVLFSSVHSHYQVVGLEPYNYETSELDVGSCFKQSRRNSRAWSHGLAPAASCAARALRAAPPPSTPASACRLLPAPPAELLWVARHVTGIIRTTVHLLIF